MFAPSINVTLQSTNSGATLYYTLDGSLPTTGSFLYSAPFVLTDNATVVTASAFETNFNNSVSNQRAVHRPAASFHGQLHLSPLILLQLGFFGTSGSNYVLAGLDQFRSIRIGPPIAPEPGPSSPICSTSMISNATNFLLIASIVYLATMNRLQSAGRQYKPGFTLIGLLIVITIIATLAFVASI